MLEILVLQPEFLRRDNLSTPMGPGHHNSVEEIAVMKNTLLIKVQSRWGEAVWREEVYFIRVCQRARWGGARSAVALDYRPNDFIRSFYGKKWKGFE